MSRRALRKLPGHVRLNGAVFYAHHGIDEDEQRIGAHYEVDVDIASDLGAAAASDQLRDAIDYARVHEHIERVVTKTSHRLLERIAMRLIDELFGAFASADTVSIAIRKLNPPVDGIVRSSEVTLSLSRTQWQSR